jgi:hypothetical protein
VSTYYCCFFFWLRHNTEAKTDNMAAIEDITFEATGKTLDGEPDVGARVLEVGDRLVVEWGCQWGAPVGVNRYCFPAPLLARGNIGTGLGFAGKDLGPHQHGELWIYPGWSPCSACNKWSTNGSPQMEYYYKFQQCNEHCGP